MKKFTIQAISLMILLFGSLYFFNPTGKSSKIDLPFLPQKIIVSNLEINGHVLKVEIADTAGKRNKGLSTRESLASDSGMLFVFPKLDKYVFWMKGMKIALDFIWIKDNQVVDLLSNVPFPKVGEKDENLSIYSSKVEFNKLLEVNAGVITSLNIKIGDTIVLP